MIDRPEVYGYTLFCDDMRLEADGRFTYVGVYPVGMAIETFPVTIPKFCIWAVMRESKMMVEARDFNVNIKVYFPGDSVESPTISGVFPWDGHKVQLIDSSGSLQEQFGDGMQFTSAIGFALSPILIKEPGLIRVRADYGGKLVALGSLHIEKRKSAPEKE